MPLFCQKIRLSKFDIYTSMYNMFSQIFFDEFTVYALLKKKVLVLNLDDQDVVSNFCSSAKVSWKW